MTSPRVQLDLGGLGTVPVDRGVDHPSADSPGEVLGTLSKAGLLSIAARGGPGRNLARRAGVAPNMASLPPPEIRGGGRGSRGNLPRD